MTSPRPPESTPRGLVWFDDPGPPPATDRLSRERVVAAAVAHADAGPGGDVTMRALAQRLGTRSPMALYRYVGSKDGLADLMADAVYGEIEVPTGVGWRAGLRGMSLSGWAAVQRHPWFARLAYSRPPLGPNALALYDASLALVEPLGLDAATRMGFVSTVLGQVLGSGLALLEEQTMRRSIGMPSDEDLAAAVRPYVQRIVGENRYPHYASWATDPERDTGGPPPFEQLVDWLLDGLERSL